MGESVRRSDWQSLKPSFYGFGINDVNYVTHKKETIATINGKQKQRLIWICPYYRKWKNMIERCYNKQRLQKYPTYQGCTVCDEWRYLSNFIEWVDSQPNKDWQNCNLDKDFLVFGNKVYSPETVVFISGVVNSFITDCGKARGDCMIGVTYVPDRKKHYRAMCSNPFTKKGEHIGYYPTEIQAHRAWQNYKHEMACQLADMQSDPRVAEALRERYSPDKDWTTA